MLDHHFLEQKAMLQDLQLVDQEDNKVYQLVSVYKGPGGACASEGKDCKLFAK